MRRRTFARLAGLCYLLAQALGSSSLADEPAALAPRPPKFVRIDRDADRNPLTLQTAVVHYVPQDSTQGPLEVDLVGAVHVGERSYYEALNKLFTQYDVVLYELVAPEGTRIPKGGRSSGHPVALLQNGMKDALNLEHQMQCVDYTGDNMVHADMSPDEFAKSMSDRGESWAGTLFRMMGAGIAQQSKRQAQGKSPEVDFLSALFSDDRAGAMKRFMAEQFDDVDSVMAALEGPQGSTLISERNKVALEKLREQIAAGKKKIAVFYGAGHLADMEQRLFKDFQLKRAGEEWLTAWNLAALQEPPANGAKTPAASDSK
ncbi:MAG: hypothetical protein AB7O59_13370 [Pirellulales bacterium]